MRVKHSNFLRRNLNDKCNCARVEELILSKIIKRNREKILIAISREKRASNGWLFVGRMVPTYGRIVGDTIPSMLTKD